jgi:hypothetical protein
MLKARLRVARITDLEDGTREVVCAVIKGQSKDDAALHAAVPCGTIMVRIADPELKELFPQTLREHYVEIGELLPKQ